jgi:hypothetical protein
MTRVPASRPYFSREDRVMHGTSYSEAMQSLSRPAEASRFSISHPKHLDGQADTRV